MINSIKQLSFLVSVFRACNELWWKELQRNDKLHTYVVSCIPEFRAQYRAVVEGITRNNMSLSVASC